MPEANEYASINRIVFRRRPIQRKLRSAVHNKRATIDRRLSPEKNGNQPRSFLTLSLSFFPSLSWQVLMTTVLVDTED